MIVANDFVTCDQDTAYTTKVIWPHHGHHKSNQNAFCRYQHLIKPALATLQAVWAPFTNMV